MPEPISANRGAASAALCDPNNACCDLPEGVTAPPGAPPQRNEQPVQQTKPPEITIPPVYITGDAAEQLTKHYDQQAAAACRNERNAAIASCPNIRTAVLESGPVTAHMASLVCAQLITAYDNCKDVMEARLKAADFCEAQGKAASLSARPGDINCGKLSE